MLCVIDSYINCPIYLRIDICQRHGQLTYRHTFKFYERYDVHKMTALQFYFCMTGLIYLHNFGIHFGSQMPYSFLTSYLTSYLKYIHTTPYYFYTTYTSSQLFH